MAYLHTDRISFSYILYVAIYQKAPWLVSYNPQSTIYINMYKNKANQRYIVEQNLFLYHY